MKKKEIVIFIPGANTVDSYREPLREFFKWFLKITGVGVPAKNLYRFKYKKEIQGKNREFIIFDWNRGISYLSRKYASAKLTKLIKSLSKDSKITLIGLSIGADVILRAINNLTNINKAILIAPVTKFRKKDSKHKIINIYSKEDKFAEISTKVLFPFSGDQKIKGDNVKTIKLDNLQHQDFCDNRKIKSGKYKGLKITDLINKLL